MSFLFNNITMYFLRVNGIQSIFFSSLQGRVLITSTTTVVYVTQALPVHTVKSSLHIAAMIPAIPKYPVLRNTTKSLAALVHLALRATEKTAKVVIIPHHNKQ